MKTKLAIAEEAVSIPHNYSHTARKYGISLSQVQRYVKQRLVLQRTPTKKLTLHPGKKSKGNEEMERYITEKVIAYNTAGTNIEYPVLILNLLRVYQDFFG